MQFLITVSEFLISLIFGRAFAQSKLRLCSLRILLLDCTYISLVPMHLLSILRSAA
jgi:hypothetical protein